MTSACGLACVFALQERLNELRQELTREKTRVEEERRRVQEERDKLRLEEQRLERQALDVKQQTHDMNDTIMVSAARAQCTRVCVFMWVCVCSAAIPAYHASDYDLIITV